MNLRDAPWRAAARFDGVACGEVHVWRASLDRPAPLFGSKAKAAECNGKIAQEYLRAVALGKAANEPSEIFRAEGVLELA